MKILNSLLLDVLDKYIYLRRSMLGHFIFSQRAIRVTGKNRYARRFAARSTNKRRSKRIKAIVV